jgi:hypothetical protein
MAPCWTARVGSEGMAGVVSGDDEYLSERGRCGEDKTSEVHPTYVPLFSNLDRRDLRSATDIQCHPSGSWNPRIASALPTL